MKKEKINYKYIVLGIIILIILVVIIVFVYKDNKEASKNKGGNNNTKVVSSYSIDLLENMEVDSYKEELFEINQAIINNGFFEGLLFYTDENVSAILNFTIVIYNKEHKELERVDFEFVDVRENEERDLYCFIDKDLSDAYYFEVEIS